MSWVLWLPVAQNDTLILDLTQAADSADVDLSLVSAATINILRPQGDEISLAATRSNQTATTLRLTHTFGAAQTSITKHGRHIVQCTLTLTGTLTRKTKPRVLTVKGKYEVADG